VTATCHAFGMLRTLKLRGIKFVKLPYTSAMQKNASVSECTKKVEDLRRTSRVVPFLDLYQKNWSLSHQGIRCTSQRLQFMALNVNLYHSNVAKGQIINATAFNLNRVAGHTRFGILIQ
jgi:hypothetical protein